MDYLYNLNLNESEILKMIDANNHIKDMSDLEMITYIYILVDIGCSQAQLLDIITANPNYFKDNSNLKAHELLEKFIKDCF